jgi:hypothetical protein
MFFSQYKRTENHVLIITGSFPALRPFWRILLGKYSSYISSLNSGGRSSQHAAQVAHGDGIHLHTVGSTPRVKKISGLYSIAVRDGSEESLNPQQQEGKTRSIEVILSNHGDHRVHNETIVASGNCSSEARHGDARIKVTREVQIT